MEINKLQNNYVLIKGQKKEYDFLSNDKENSNLGEIMFKADNVSEFNVGDTVSYNPKNSIPLSVNGEDLLFVKRDTIYYSLK